MPPFSAVLKRVWRRHSLRHLLAGSTVASLVGFGLNAFLAAFLMRRFGFSMAQTGLIAGIIASLPAAFSMVASGWLADRLGSGDSRCYGYIPGISLLIAAPVYLLALTRTDAIPAIILLGIATLFQYTYLGPTFGVFQNMMHPRMRATSSAFNSMLYTLIGNGLGPVLVGVLSNNSSADPAHSGPGEGLMLAMALACIGYLWAAGHYLWATRSLREEFALPIEEGLAIDQTPLPLHS